MLDYNLELVGSKIAEIKPFIEAELEGFSNDKKKIEYVKTKLFECIPNDDIITALAIINCAIGITGISAREFDLHCVEKKAYADFHGTFALSFIAKLTLCKVLNSVKRVNVTAVAYNDLKALTLFDKPSYLFCVQFFLEKPTLKMHN